MDGLVCLHRSVFDNDLFSRDSYSRREAWIFMVAHASHKERTLFIDNQPIKINRGELAWSQLSLAKKWAWSRQNVRTFLKTLEQQNMIGLKSNQHTTIITICNFNKYQDILYETNQRVTNDQPTGNQRVTNDQPTTNQRVTTNNNAHISKMKKSDFNGQYCDSIFEHWKIVMGHPQSQMLDKRKKLIQKTLDSDYTPMQAKLAIDGHKKSKWHMDNGFDGIEYSLKPENIDKFIKMAGMTNDELNKSSGKLNWDDTSWADGLQAEYGIRN